MLWSLLNWPGLIADLYWAVVVIVTMSGLVCDMCYCMLWSLLHWSVVILTMSIILSSRTMTARRCHCYNDRKTVSLLQWTVVIVAMTTLQINTITDRSLLQWPVVIITMTWSVIYILYVVVIVTMTGGHFNNDHNIELQNNGHWSDCWFVLIYCGYCNNDLVFELCCWMTVAHCNNDIWSL